jgi:hypothetical protein
MLLAGSIAASMASVSDSLLVSNHDRLARWSVQPQYPDLTRVVFLLLNSSVSLSDGS